MAVKRKSGLIVPEEQKLIVPKNTIAVPWSDVRSNIINPVRNTQHEYLHFINSSYFSEEAHRFLRYGYYTSAPYGTPEYEAYWDEQERRCIEGYSVGGVRITGRHYFFLNFVKIKARKIDVKTGLEDQDDKRKIITFPRFLDHQYYWFHELEECYAEGPYVGQEMKGMVMFKSRRKGFTYIISGGVFAYNFNFVPASVSVLAAYEKGYYKVTLDGIHFTLNHINKSTDWSKRRDKLNKRDHFKASYVITSELGNEIEEGYMSEVRAISFKDDAFKSIGESTYTVGFEEAGKFPGLLSSLTISEPTYRDGDVMVGVPLVWGAAGDIENGSKDLEEIFYNPAAYGMKAYENIYDENAVGDCGWFIDDMWYYPGLYNDGVRVHMMVDAQGNSYREYAEKQLDQKRTLRKKGSKHAFNKFITQQPKTPREGFLRTQGTIFDVVTAQNRLADILTDKKKWLDSIWRADLRIDSTNGKVKYLIDTVNEPIYEFPIKDNKDKYGCVEIYEMPYRNDEGRTESLRYIAGIDSYDDDASDTTSLGSLILLDRWTDRIVCHYKGRPMLAKDFWETCRRILLFYGATANYERRNKGIYGHFTNTNSLYLLCDEPEFLKDRGISHANTKGNNAKGTYPSTPVLNYANTLIIAWCEALAYSTDPESAINNLMKLRSVGILQEIIHFVDDDRMNFDDISALRMLMLYRESLVPMATNVKQKSITQDPYLQRVKSKQLSSQLSRNSYHARGIRFKSLR